MMTEEQMDQFEDDMREEDVNLIMEDLRQSIIDEKLNELITYYDIEAKNVNNENTMIERIKDIGSNILAISKRLMHFVRGVICAFFYCVIMLLLSAILGWLWDLGVFIVLLIVIGLMIVAVKLCNEMLK